MKIVLICAMLCLVNAAEGDKDKVKVPTIEPENYKEKMVYPVISAKINKDG